jgi:hypothetical protein
LFLFLSLQDAEGFAGKSGPTFLWMLLPYYFIKSLQHPVNETFFPESENLFGRFITPESYANNDEKRILTEAAADGSPMF